ncbi:hypothetical protein MNBD_GAMMA09-520 [hydrothermal vent metagenome]|uniref:Uncharacterized protein n=1 Tax=hydrothermal vent metagenome TaxID=652676 RepID=A0A3B0X6D4_9ZZZZ
MKFFIRVWSENTIVLMTESGHVLSYFTTVKDALSACEEWYSCNAQERRHEVQVHYKKTVNVHTSVAIA